MPRSQSALTLTRGHGYSIRQTPRRRKPGVNARPPAARQRPEPEPRLRHRRRLRAGNSDRDRPRPPAADIYFVEIHRHGPDNPTASVRTSKWTTSIIPPGAFQRMQTCPRALARSHARTLRSPSLTVRVYSEFKYRVSPTERISSR